MTLGVDIMQIRKLSVGAVLVLAGAMASMTAEGGGPSMSSSWVSITSSQDECVKRATQSIRNNSFNSNFEVLGNSSIYGERGDYTALVRCAADKGIVYFVVAGPKGDTCSSHMNAIKDGF
jgi:hypothetical protein